MPERARGIAVDEVVLDLEDSVPADDKDSARAQLDEALGAGDWEPRSVAVRVNGVDTPWCRRDLGELIGPRAAAVGSIVVPKVERPGDLLYCDRMLAAHERDAGASARVGLQALIETAAGLRAVDSVAAATPRLEALILGPADLAASLGLAAAEPAARDEALDFARAGVVAAARAAGVAAIDGPYLSVDDEDGLRRSAQRARSLGFDGKWAIHPRQVGPLEEVFTPTAEELDRARAILAALAEADGDGRGAVALEGEMVDEASRKRAEALLARAPS